MVTVADNPFETVYPAGEGPDTQGHAKRRKAYRAARRHSILVRVLRISLPILGVIILAGIFAVSWITKPKRFDITIAGQTVSVNGIIMGRPTLTGFDTKNRRYRVSAETAVQAITSPDQIRLKNIEAEITLPDEGTAIVTAGGGDYDNKASTLHLIGGISVDSTLGYQLTMKNAEIDLNAGTLLSKNPVTIRYEDSEVTGDTLKVSEGGEIIVLEGRVDTRLMPPKRTTGSTADPAIGPAAGPATGKAGPKSIEDLIEGAD